MIVRANKFEIYITNAVLGSLYGIYICKYGFGNLGGFGDIEQDLHAGGIYIRLLRSGDLGFGRAINLSRRGVLPTGGCYQISFVLPPLLQ